MQSAESLAGREPVLGLPPDPSKDLEEMMEEAKAEFEARQRRGSMLKGKNPVAELSSKEL